MKVEKNKIISLLIGGVIVASAGGYALAAQVPNATAQSAASSEITSQVSSALETEVSSMDESSTTSQEVSSTQPVASEPAKESTSPEKASSVEPENSMKPNVLYYAVVDPDTGRLVWPKNPAYWDIKNKLGGDAGTTDPDHSTACQAALKAYRDKQAASKQSSSK